ncbi:cation-transporting P-type ATPase [Filimonas effusa]|uniref:Cation-transporting P-type ATPase n=1 Tax=Filimonas effusa TaxID=2508721 RepID=A0A4V1MAR8_9BACT|nr:cation-transporting P-type ATPase [Filimonas effusa]RXK86826.1 cation-transporting P-type ATPase [Filimonas effusa]
MNKKQLHQQEWYRLNKEEVVQQIATDANAGLSNEEAKKRIKQYGRNKLPEKKKSSKFIRFLKHFHDILIYVLLCAAIVTGILGHYTDTIVIVVVAVVNACIGYFQESKAEDALKSIQNMLSLKAHVIRDNKRIEIDAEEVTIGDIVLLNAGDKVPADLRLLSTDSLKIEESVLTGESEASEKKADPLEGATELGDRINMAFTSTTISAGTGRGVVTAIGKDTEIGKINQMMTEVEQLTTPLLQQTAKFGKTISIFIIVIAGATYLFGHFLRDYPDEELLMSIIGLAVAAIPEGLPAILSIILAIGVRNMAKHNAIVRNLPSVETLGSVSVICSDKTGTLTKNEMTVQQLAVRDGSYHVSGIGYAPEGSITRDAQEVHLDENQQLKQLISCFHICNEASLDKDKDDHWMIKGDPTEGALITLSHKAGFSGSGRDSNRKATIPFDSDYKYMATMVEAEEDQLIYIKGAPDRLLDMANREERPDGAGDFDKPYWENRISELAGEGQRVIGAAYKRVDKNKQEISHDDLGEGVVFLGLAGIIDPPREEAIEAISLCKEAGITVKMITGDHADTARAIGAQMGIDEGGQTIQGKELQEMDDEALRKAAEANHVFARTSPEHKLRLVNALQANGSICAMTGDGVNDAPALKQANVGIAMGIKGTEVTKEAAEMVLADDNFSTIVEAVKEGRRIYDNLKKTILFILPTNGAESFLIMASILFGTIMPLTPVQILWVNMVTSLTVSLALAFEPIEADAMQRPPRPTHEPLLSRYFIWRILFVSVFIGGGTLWLCTHLLNMGIAEETVKTITLQTIVIAQLFHLFNCRSVSHSAFNQDFFSNRAIYVVAGLLFVLQAGVTYLPFMNRVFGTEPLSLQHWQWPFYLGLATFVVIELEKAIVRNLVYGKKQATMVMR